MKICFTVDAEQHAAILAYAKRRGFANSGQFARWACFLAMSKNRVGAHHAIAEGLHGSKIGRPPDNSGALARPSF